MSNSEVSLYYKILMIPAISYKSVQAIMEFMKSFQFFSLYTLWLTNLCVFDKDCFLLPLVSGAGTWTHDLLVPGVAQTQWSRFLPGWHDWLKIDSHILKSEILWCPCFKVKKKSSACPKWTFHCSSLVLKIWCAGLHSH